VEAEAEAAQVVAEAAVAVGEELAAVVVAPQFRSGGSNHPKP
jgi:hypothetical protein